jgi:hypothetical protein
MTKLEDLIIIAQQIPYVEPSPVNIDEWSNDELLYKSINIALHNIIQIKAGLYICSLFSPLKLIYKSILNAYIKYFNGKSEAQPSIISAAYKAGTEYSCKLLSAPLCRLPAGFVSVYHNTSSPVLPV